MFCSPPWDRDADVHPCLGFVPPTTLPQVTVLATLSIFPRVFLPRLSSSVQPPDNQSPELAPVRHLLSGQPPAWVPGVSLRPSLGKQQSVQ